MIPCNWLAISVQFFISAIASTPSHNSRKRRDNLFFSTFEGGIPEKDTSFFFPEKRSIFLSREIWKRISIGKLQNYNRPIKNGKVKMGPTATFSSAVVIAQRRMKFSFFSYLSSISMFFYSSQTANPILTLYLGTEGFFDENTKSIQKTKIRLKDFFKTNFCKYVF